MDVRIALDRVNVELPSGRIDGRQVELNVRAASRFSTAAEFNELIVFEADGRVVRLKDVGEAVTYVQGRNTKDVDLLMAAADARKIPGIRIDEENDFFASGRFRSVRVDLLLTRNPLFEAVARHCATVHRFAELNVPAVTVEGLILLKLYALPSLYRQLDWDRIYVHESDIKQLLARYRPPVDGLLQFLKPHMIESDINELRRFLLEATERIAEVERKGEQ